MRDRGEMGMGMSESWEIAGVRRTNPISRIYDTQYSQSYDISPYSQNFHRYSQSLQRHFFVGGPPGVGP